MAWNPAQHEQWQPITEPRPVIARRHAATRTLFDEIVAEVAIHDDGTISLSVECYPLSDVPQLVG